MKRAFSLLELLVVIGIMGLLGTVSIGGYRAINRGMAEKGAVDNASQFMHTAFQRSMIDRQPVAVYYWNETIRDGSGADDYAVVVGKAVAVRSSGRLSRVDGDVLYDEFADLNLAYTTEDELDNPRQSVATMNLYPMDDPNEDNYSTVRSFVVKDEHTPSELKNETDPVDGKPTILMYGFERVSGYDGWSIGSAYGFEFQYLTLPHNFIFGGQGDYSEDIKNPIRGKGKIVFGRGAGGYDNLRKNSKDFNLQISALRVKNGQLSADFAGKVNDPTSEGDGN